MFQINIKKGFILTNLSNPRNISLFLALLEDKTSEDVFYFTFEAPKYGGYFFNNKHWMFKNFMWRGGHPDNVNIDYSHCRVPE